MFPRPDINTYESVWGDRKERSGGMPEWWNGGTAEGRKINQNPKTRKDGDSIHSLKGGWPKKKLKRKVI